MLTPQQIRDKIEDEIIVDAYDDIEVSMGWYYTFDEQLTFPFMATAQLKKKDGSVESKQVKVVGLHSKEEGFTDHDFQFTIEQNDYLVPIAYSALSNIVADDQTLEMFQIWNYWVDGY